MVIASALNTRSEAESGTSATEDGGDNVELEKSNVLLMGPTGSGKVPVLYLIFSLLLTLEISSFWEILKIIEKLLIMNMLPMPNFDSFIDAICCDPGKTLLAKTLARFVNVPIVIADATTLTQASYC